MLKGIAASPGIATVKAIILDSEKYEIPQRTVDSSLIPAEMDRIGRAFDASIDELTRLEAEHNEVNETEIHALFSVHGRFPQDRGLRRRLLIAWSAPDRRGSVHSKNTAFSGLRVVFRATPFSATMRKIQLLASLTQSRRSCYPYTVRNLGWGPFRLA